VVTCNTASISVSSYDTRHKKEEEKKTTVGSTALSNAVWDPQIRSSSSVSLLCTHYCCPAARSKWGRGRRIL